MITLRWFKDWTLSKQYQDLLKDDFKGDLKISKQNFCLIEPINTRQPLDSFKTPLRILKRLLQDYLKTKLTHVKEYFKSSNTDLVYLNLIISFQYLDMLKISKNLLKSKNYAHHIS